MSTLVAPATTNPSATGVATDVSFSWQGTANRLLIQNQSAAAVFLDFEQAASPASISLAAGATLAINMAVSVLHLYAAANTPINATGGVIIRAWQIEGA